MPAIPATVDVPFETFDLKEAYVEGRVHGSLTFQCAWASRHTLARQLLGSATMQTPGGPDVEYTLPAELPFIDGAFVKDIPNISGYPAQKHDHDKSGAISTQTYPDYQYAHLTVNYEIPIWGTNPPGSGSQPFIEESIEGTTEFRTRSAKGLKWGDDTPVVDPASPQDDFDAPTQIIRKLVFTWRIQGIPTLPIAVLTLMGSTNNANVVFNTLGLVAGPETLLYTPPVLRRFVYANGAGAWDATFTFPYDPQGQNKHWRGAKTLKEPMFDEAGNPVVIYPPANFALLGL